ncbi:hypothetical protein [Aquabacterium sp.]|uniref:hypothetical protein n=1 Tax=Aquabacterium sp. TaxID=1872578 RepID=UPI0019BD9CD6|nr:hypothetical protein [Aquabacterium sp.]MBC7701414.1 hypothetical protein [Aquabacterium sp.]
MKNPHVNPAESVQIFKDLGCKRAMAVHWGTFQLTDEALAIGQTWRWPVRVDSS